MGRERIQRRYRGWWAAAGGVAVVAIAGLVVPGLDGETPGPDAKAQVSAAGTQDPDAGAAERVPTSSDRHGSGPADSSAESLPPTTPGVPQVGASTTAALDAGPTRPRTASSPPGRDTGASPGSAPGSEPGSPAGHDDTLPGHHDTDVARALTLLDGIATKGRAPRTGYDRSLFGPAWSDDVTVDLGHNGCDTRNDVLRRDLIDVVLKPDSHGCAVVSGTLPDPYTGRSIPFVRGSTSSAAVQIDHVVALSDAWQKGAQGWDGQRKRDFANDPENLQATDGVTNQRKGAGDAATWLPPNRRYWCSYVARQTLVKNTYGLWMTPAEKQRIGEILNTCLADRTAPSTTPASTPGSTTPASAPGSTTPTSTPTSDAPASSPTVDEPRTNRTAAPRPPTVTTPAAPVYRNCTDVWDRHGGPILRGEPGYQPKFDGDDDGIGCEKPPG